MLRGEIWCINLDPTIGAEIRKIRPVIIVNDDEIGILPLKIVVPITDWKDRYENAVWMTKIKPNKENGLSKTSSADAFQVRSVSQERFVEKIGNVSEETLEEITESLAIVLKIQ
ncbi:MAG: type II toxin-antitoxin system PemK/MazF family toxin [Acidobacteriota bacterium]